MTRPSYHRRWPRNSPLHSPTPPRCTAHGWQRHGMTTKLCPRRMHPPCSDIACRMVVVPMSSTMGSWQTCMPPSLKRHSMPCRHWRHCPSTSLLSGEPLMCVIAEMPLAVSHGSIPAAHQQPQQPRQPHQQRQLHQAAPAASAATATTATTAAPAASAAQAASGRIRPHQATSGHIRPHQAASGKQHPQHQPHQQRQLQQPRQPRPQHRPHQATSGRTFGPYQAVSGRIRPHQTSSTSSTSRISSASYSSRASRVRSTSRIRPHQAVHQQQPHQPSPYRASPYRESPYCRAYRPPRSQLSKRCPQRHRIAWSQLCPRLTSKSVLRSKKALLIIVPTLRQR